MKRKIFLIIISILILTLSILGFTYAFMKPQVEEKESKRNITISACAKIQLKDNGNSINLENTFPMDNDMGLETEPYEFTITSTCENYVGFNLYLTSLSDNQIEDNNIHFAVTSKSKDILSEGILSSQEKGDKDFNSEELKELDIGINGNHKNIYKVYSNNIPFQSESKYQLYLWVDKDANNETMGKSLKVGLSLKSYNRKETMAEYLIKNKDNTLIYHDGSYKDENGNVTDAFDYSYRYAGASEEVKNFVCLDGGVTIEDNCASDADLYRIIGLFKNELNLYEIKLIKYDYATSEQLGETGAYNAIYSDTTTYYKGNKDNLTSIGGYFWTSDSNQVNEWINSELRKTNLNDYYLNTYLKKVRKMNIDNLIENHTWSLKGYNTNNEVTPKEMYDMEMDKVEIDLEALTQTREVQDKIGLMYVSDYGYATSPSNWNQTLSIYENATVKNNNWMYMGLTEWTITHSSIVNNFTSIVYFYGRVGGGIVSSSTIAVRPCFYLTSDIQIKGGDGTYKNPYRLSLN